MLVAVQLLEEILCAVPRRIHALTSRLLLQRQPRLQHLVLRTDGIPQ